MNLSDTSTAETRGKPMVVRLPWSDDALTQMTICPEVAVQRIKGLDLEKLDHTTILRSLAV